MLKVELVYFGLCPNVDRAREAIRKAGIESFNEVNQDSTGAEHPYTHYSSPTVLVNGRIVAGSCNGGAACSIIQWDIATDSIRDSVCADSV
jgi:hypothetical protein